MTKHSFYLIAFIFFLGYCTCFPWYTSNSMLLLNCSYEHSHANWMTLIMKAYLELHCMQVYLRSSLIRLLNQMFEVSLETYAKFLNFLNLKVHCFTNWQSGYALGIWICGCRLFCKGDSKRGYRGGSIRLKSELGIFYSSQS